MEPRIRTTFNDVYAVTGSDPAGYTVAAGTVCIAPGTVTLHKHTDIGINTAPTPTTEGATALCHGTFTNTSTSYPGCVSVPLTGSEHSARIRLIGSGQSPTTQGHRLRFISRTAEALVLGAHRRWAWEPTEVSISTARMERTLACPRRLPGDLKQFNHPYLWT